MLDGLIGTFTFAEIMEEEIFCTVQSGQTRLSAQVLQESRGEGQSSRRDWLAAVGPPLVTLQFALKSRKSRRSKLKKRSGRVLTLGLVSVLLHQNLPDVPEPWAEPQVGLDPENLQVLVLLRSLHQGGRSGLLPHRGGQVSQHQWMGGSLPHGLLRCKSKPTELIPKYPPQDGKRAGMSQKTQNRIVVVISEIRSFRNWVGSKWFLLVYKTRCSK